MTAETLPNVRPQVRISATALDRVAVVLWLVAIYISGVSFQSADWADHLGLVPRAAVFSALLGLLLARSRFRGRTAFGLGFAYGLFFLGLWLGRTLEPSLTWGERIADLVGRTGAFLFTLAKGEPSRDPLMFVLLMTGLFWILGCYGSWVIFRRQGFWGALLIPGLALAVNMHLYRGGLNLTHYVPIYLLLALVLALRTELSLRRDTWAQWKALVPSDASYQIARAGLVAGALLVGVAWLLPGFTAYEKVSAAWNDSGGLLGNVRELVSDAFGGLRYPVTVVSETFGDSLELGAGRLPPEKPMFVAQPDSPPEDGARVYWRARVLDTYEAGRWTVGQAPLAPFDPSEGGLQLPAYAGRVDKEFAITAQVSAMHLLYVPPQPRWVNRETEWKTLAAGQDGFDVQEVTAHQFVLEGETYRVISSLSVPRADSLRGAGKVYPAWVVARYLQVPVDLPGAVFELAESIGAGAETPYDQAAAVTTWLRSNITYQRDAEAPPEGADPIEWFLFESRTGFCDYYASAEVLMLRTLGIPARLAVGFAQGEYDPERNAYYVSAIDSHAWPEVFFPSYGWVEFEPTRSQPALIRTEAGEAGVGNGVGATGPDAGDPSLPGGGIPGEDPLFSPAGDVEDVTLGPAGTAARRWGWGVAALAVVLAATAFSIFRHRLVGRAENGEGLPDDTLGVHGWGWWASAPSRRAYRSLVRWAHWLGLSPGPAATPAEQAEALASGLPAVGQAAVAVAEAYSLERYGLGPVDGKAEEEEWNRARPSLVRAWLVRRGVPFLSGLVRRRPIPERRKTRPIR
jgi:transglutaminase-like putative cysteine protease